MAEIAPPRWAKIAVIARIVALELLRAVVLYFDPGQI